MAYIVLNVDSREIYDTVFVVEDNALAKQAELGVSWVIVERELETVKKTTVAKAEVIAE